MCGARGIPVVGLQSGTDIVKISLEIFNELKLDLLLWFGYSTSLHTSKDSGRLWAFALQITCSALFLASLFTIGRGIETINMYMSWLMSNEKRYIYTMQFHSAVKKNETLEFAGKWMNLENIVQYKVNPSSKKQTLHYFLIYLRTKLFSLSIWTLG